MPDEVTPGATAGTAPGSARRNELMLRRGLFPDGKEPLGVVDDDDPMFWVLDLAITERLNHGDDT